MDHRDGAEKGKAYLLMRHKILNLIFVQFKIYKKRKMGLRTTSGISPKVIRNITYKVRGLAEVFL